MTSWYDNYVKGQTERINHDSKVFKWFVKPETGFVCEIGGYPYIFTKLINRHLDSDSVFSVVDKKTDYNLAVSSRPQYFSRDIELRPLPFLHDSQDVVVLSEVFEHLKKPIFVSSEIERVLKEEGILILTTPNLYKLENCFSFLTGRGFNFGTFGEWNKKYELGYTGHVREYSPKELREFFPFEIIGFERVTFKSKNNRFFYLVKKLFPFLREHQVLVMRKWKTSHM